MHFTHLINLVLILTLAKRMKLFFRQTNRTIVTNGIHFSRYKELTESTTMHLMYKNPLFCRQLCERKRELDADSKLRTWLDQTKI